MKYFIHVVIPVLAGGFIYFLGRNNDLILYDWFPALQVFKHNVNLPNWVKYNLPDGIWMYSVTSLMVFLWQKKVNYNSLGWIISGIIIAVVIEFFQKFGFFPGTFDWMDLCFYIIAFIFASIHLVSIRKIKLLLTLSAGTQN